MTIVLCISTRICANVGSAKGGVCFHFHLSNAVQMSGSLMDEDEDEIIEQKTS